MRSLPERSPVPNVAVIIVTYKNWRDSLECLESLFRVDYGGYQVIVVDNGPVDGSVDYIQKWVNGELDVFVSPASLLRHLSFPPVEKPISYKKYDSEASNESYATRCEYDLVHMASEVNLGFTGGNNIAIKYAMDAGFDYILLLNNDTVVDKHVLAALVDRAQHDDGVGIVGGKIYYYDRPATIQSVGAMNDFLMGCHPLIGNGEMDKGQHNIVNNNVDYVSGALMLIKRRVVEKIGFLDDNFFLYLDDVDYCYHALMEGFGVCVEPEAVIWHASSSGGRRVSHSYLYYSNRNRIVFLKKYFSAIRLLYYLPVYARGAVTYLKCIMRGNHKGAYLVLKGLFDGAFRPGVK